MSTRDLIDAIESGNSSAIQQHFQDAIMSRVAERLDTMRIETAKNMFKSAVNESAELDEGFPYDVDHMPGRRLSMAGVNKTAKYTVATNSIGGHKEQRVEVDATSKNHARNLAADHFVKNGLKPRVHFDGVRVVNESADFIHQVLADNDINSKVMGNTVHVDHDDVEKAQELVKYHGYDHKVIGGLNEAKKLIGTYDNGDHTAKVYHLSGEHNEGDPYHVKLFKDGKHHEPADYFTNDKDDAHSTAKDMVRCGSRNESVKLDETSCGTKKKWGAIKNSMGGSTKK